MAARNSEAPPAKMPKREPIVSSLPLQPPSVGTRLDLGREGGGVFVEELRVVQGAVEQTLSGETAEGEAGEQTGDQHRQGNGVGVLAEPRDVGDANLAQVSKNAEEGTDQEDVRAADAGQRGIDVLAVIETATVAGVNGSRDAAGESDVRSHEGTEGQVVQAEGVSGCGKDSPGGQHAEAGEDEGVVAANGSSDSAAGDGGEEPEDEDSNRGGEHRCSFMRAGSTRDRMSVGNDGAAHGLSGRPGGRPPRGWGGSDVRCEVGGAVIGSRATPVSAAAARGSLPGDVA